MPSKLLLQAMDDTPAQIVFANHAGDFSPAAANDRRVGTPTNGELVMLNWVNGTGIQSAKVDLGEHYAERYACIAVLEMQVTAATNGEVAEFRWNGSSSSTAANANLGGASGSSAAYSGYSSDLETAIRQLVRIGKGTLTDDAVNSVQIMYCGDLWPTNRYGSLIGINRSGQTICDTDDVEAHIVLDPYIPEQQ